MKNANLVECHQVVQLLANATDAAGRDGAFATLKNCIGKAKVIVEVNQGNAANVNVTLKQAVNVAGGSAKAGPATLLWVNADTANTDAFTKQTDAASYLCNGATLTNKVAIFEVDPVTLDVANGFDCISVSTGASNAANITSARLLIPCGYQQKTPPSAVAN